MNLFSNALKFTLQGKITLNVEAVGKDMKMLKFTVADTGIGIKLEDQDKLFKAFGRLDKTSYVNPYGVGLGLVISNNLVSLLNPTVQNSHIELESQENVGSKFIFSIDRKLLIDEDEIKGRSIAVDVDKKSRSESFGTSFSDIDELIKHADDWERFSIRMDGGCGSFFMKQFGPGS